MNATYYRQLFGLENKVAIVTGASRGLGQSMALALGRAGASVCLVGRQPNLSETTALMKEHGCQAMEIICDQTKEDGVEQIFNGVLDKWGQIDILVNNAGTYIRKPTMQVNMDEWDYVMSVNLRSVYRLCQEAGRTMLKQKKGKIMNIASVLAFQGGVNVPAYSASRHGLLGLTKSLSNEWASEGININAIAPGYMDTDQNADLFGDPIRSKQLMDRIPAQRWGQQNEIDGACLFLASDASNYVNGQTLVVDGGWMGR